jgi:hypothetical protein
MICVISSSLYPASRPHPTPSLNTPVPQDKMGMTRLSTYRIHFLVDLFVILVTVGRPNRRQHRTRLFHPPDLGEPSWGFGEKGKQGGEDDEEDELEAEGWASQSLRSGRILGREWGVGNVRNRQTNAWERPDTYLRPNSGRGQLLCHFSRLESSPSQYANANPAILRKNCLISLIPRPP